MSSSSFRRMSVPPFVEGPTPRGPVGYRLSASGLDRSPLPRLDDLTPFPQGLRSTATMMYGHVEEAWHVARHLAIVRAIQQDTGGFTEFVPLSFVAREAPMYKVMSIVACDGWCSSPRCKMRQKIHTELSSAY
jgi:hypothetical protein